MARGRTGRCRCGAVSYTADTDVTRVLQCHCENCRRLSGNFVAAIRTATSDLSIDDPQGDLRWDELGYAAYAFCRSCGSTLFFRATDTPGTTSLMVGTLDDAAGLELAEVWFADEAQPHNPLPDEVERFHGNA